MAQYQTVHLEAAVTPHMKDDARKTFLRDLNKRAAPPHRRRPPEPIHGSPEELQQMLGIAIEGATPGGGN